PNVYLGAFSLAGLVKLGAERLRAAPLWRYHYGVHGTDLDTLLPWPYLHRLDLFTLRPPLPDDWASRLAACDNLRNVSELSFIDCRVTAGELRQVLDAWNDRHLTTLDLRPPAGDWDLVDTVVSHPAMRNLRRLTLSHSITKDNVARFIQ